MLDKEQLAVQGLLWLDSAALMTDMHAVVQNRKWTGFAAYRALATRIPILWPFLPFLYLWPIPIIGHRMYRYIGICEVCNIADTPSLKTDESGSCLRLSANLAVSYCSSGMHLRHS
jgi:hypothetical protein